MKKKGHAWKQAPSPGATLSLLLGSSVAPSPAPPLPGSPSPTRDPHVLPSPPPTISLLPSALLAPTLFSLCSKPCTKALTDPRAVTQTVKNVYMLVAFHFCVLILRTHTHALTHGVSGASSGCRPREPSQSKGIWALFEQAGKGGGKKRQTQRRRDRSSPYSLCPCSARLCLPQQTPRVPCHSPHGCGWLSGDRGGSIQRCPRGSVGAATQG